MKLFWPKSTSLKSKPAKYINLQKFVTEVFKVKIGLSPKLMKDIYRKTVLSTVLLRLEDPNEKI